MLLVLSLAATAQAQDVNKFMKKAANAENVEKVKIGGFLMFVAKTFGAFDDVPEMKGLKGVEIYDLSECYSGLKQELVKEFGKIKDGNGYETLIQIKDGGDNIRIMVKKDKKNNIREMIFLCMEKDDPAIIKISGKISENDIAQLVNEYSK